MIHRTNKSENPFTQIDNYPLTDPSLSWKAKGILGYLLSKPNQWNVVITQLIKASSDGKESTRSGVQELIDKGYIHKSRAHREDGTFESFDYEVYENPRLNKKEPFTENPEMDTHKTKPLPENPEMVHNETEPISGKSGNGSKSNEATSGKSGNGSKLNQAISGKPACGKPATSNTDVSNTKTQSSFVAESEIECLPDSEAYDWPLMSLVPEDYPKGTIEGRVLRLTIWFHQKVRMHFGDYKHVKNANLFKWREHIRLLYEQDDIPLQKMVDVIEWIFHKDPDRFWYTVIRSTDNLRDKWDNINAAILRAKETQKAKDDKRRKYTKHEGTMLMLDNGLLKSERSGGGYVFEDLFEPVGGEGKHKKFVIKKSCLNLFKNW